MENKQIDILDVLLILAKHKKFIFWTTLIVSIAAVVYSLVTPLYWSSNATILQSKDQGSLGIDASKLIGINLPFLGKSSGTNSADLLTIMKSRSFTENVINEFKLKNYFEIAPGDSLFEMEQAVANLLNNVVSIMQDDDTGLITISVITKDKYLSADIANYYWSRLQDYLKEKRVTKSRKQKIFISERLDELLTNRDSLKNKVLEFQKTTNVIDIELQTEATMTRYSDYVAQMKQLEINRDLSLLNYDQLSPEIKRINDEIEILAEQISSIDKSESCSGMKYGLKISEIPELTLQYLDYKMQYTINEQLFQYLYPKYEQARINELQEIPMIEVLDKAIPAGRRSKPKRAIICITLFCCALLISSILVFIFDAFNAVKKDANRFKKVLDIKKALTKKLL